MIRVTWSRDSSDDIRNGKWYSVGLIAGLDRVLAAEPVGLSRAHAFKHLNSD